jgi:shikimate kinase
VIKQIIPVNELAKIKLKVSLNSEIPTGYGLKSSSAISSAVSLGCAKLFRPDMNETEILRIGVDASIKTKVSLTGAYDDACACYYGGFNVTDNYNKKIIHSEKCLDDISAIIFLPKSRKRGKIKKLVTLSNVFERAWNFARNSDYWNAMIINGLATSAILGSDPKIISKLIENGALGASISGNGPSIAAIAKNDVLSDVKKVFAPLDGNVTITKINNKKAEVYEV